MKGEAELVCHDCQWEWAAHGTMGHTAGGDGLFTPDHPQMCPECWSDEWGYGSFLPDEATG